MHGKTLQFRIEKTWFVQHTNGVLCRFVHICPRKCITGFIPEPILKRSRDKFLNFPTRNQRKAFIINLRTPKSRYCTPFLYFLFTFSTNCCHSFIDKICFTWLVCLFCFVGGVRFLWLCSGFGRSGLALGSGLFPICQKGAKQLFGVGCGLIHSILETPKAPSHPHPFRVGVPGISTFPKQNAQTSPLVSKGDIVERYIVLTTLLYTI